MRARHYSRPEPTPFPRELAVMIARKSELMAKRFESQAMRQLVRDAQRALDRGATVDEIAKQLEMS